MSKEILEKQRLELWGKIEEFQKQHNDIVQKMYKDISLNFSEQFTVTITEDRINFNLTGDSWYDFEIRRKMNWGSLGVGKARFGEAKLNTSSISDADNKSLKKLVLMGEIARANILDTQQWADLVGLMDKYWELKERDINPIRENIYKIEDAIKILNKNETENKLKTIFNKGSLLLTKQVCYTYGNGRHDHIYSDEFIWTMNPSGKTFELYYFETNRTNSHWDAEGNSQPGIFERIKKQLHKRVRKIDIEQLISYNINYVKNEDSIVI